jgi:hypothetical protein
MDRVKRSVEYPPRSPDLTPVDFYLWGGLKNSVYQKAKNTAGPEAQNSNCLCCCSTNNPAISCLSVEYYYRLCTGAGGGRSKHCEFNVAIETVG